MFSKIANIRHCLSILVFSISFLNVQSQELVISEFLAINNSVLTDEDGDYPDWIEIYNSDTLSINLNGWFLTDNPLKIAKWQFPNITLASGEYLVVFASEKNRTLVPGHLHTNFKLSGSGEFLALVKPDGITISSSFDPSYPPQQANVSYGLYSGQNIYITNPSPGTINTIEDYIVQPDFSHERGFYSSSFSVILSSLNSNCDIFFTTDGTRPSTTSGIKYTSPVSINKTTVLSAVAIDKTLLTMSDIVTQSYLFIDSILAQPNDPIGYPAEWGLESPADYEMDPELCSPRSKSAMEEALKSLPTISLVTDVSNLFSHEYVDTTGGIYIYTQEVTEAWERAVSMEYFDSVQNKSFQVNCGLRLHGGNSRKPGNSPKHGFRVSFRSEYGPSKLNFNMFEEKSAVNEFNSLVLRAGYNYSWVKNAPAQCEGADYIRDPFAKKTQLDMDRTAAHTKFVHLYLNGMYWGVYNISEKITNDFSESYFGGDEDDYDVVKDHFGIVDGNRVAWDSLMSATSRGFESMEEYQKVQGNNVDGSVNETYPKLLDVRNLVDYMIINFYIANGDWDNNNWLAGRNRVTNEHGFKFLCWDAETAMNELGENTVTINNVNNPSSIYTELRKNEEFRLFFADRVNKHFFNGGALTPGEAETRYMNIASTIDKALLAESARWGDYRRDVDPGESSYELYNVANHWQDRVNFMQNTYLPQRSEIVFNQLKDANLFPDIDAPVFSPFGGDYSYPITLDISAGSDTILYTIDNSDPREIGGAIALTSAFRYIDSITLTQDVIIKARAKNGNTWSALTRAKFNIVSDPRIPILISPLNGAPVDPDQEIRFIWSKPTGDDLTYSFSVYKGDDTITYKDLTDTSFAVPANRFAQNKPYLWKVVASTGVGETESMAYSFNTNNIAPGAFGITSHANGDIIDATTDVIYSWSKSKDEDNIYYEFSINDGKSKLVYATKETMYLVPGNTLQKGRAYSLHVIASDGKTISLAPKVELNTLTELLEMETKAQTKIYPNPTRNTISIEIQVEQPLTISIELFDIAGRILQTKTLENLQGKHTELIDMTPYNQGIYFAVIRSTGHNRLLIRTEKIVKH